VIAGKVILTAIEIPLTAFQIAGGIVLFVFALAMILAENCRETRNISHSEKQAFE
jgi:multiple antibiotic resistance protein